MFKTKKRGNGPEAKHIAPVTKNEGIDAFDQIKKQLQASYEITKYSDADKAVLTHRLNDAVTAVEALVNELSKQIATQSQRQLLANELYLASIPNEVRIRLQTILTKKELLTVKWSLVLDLIEAEDDENTQCDYLIAAQCIAEHPFYFVCKEEDLPQVDWSKGLRLSEKKYSQANQAIESHLHTVDDIVNMSFSTEREKAKCLLRIILRKRNRLDKTLMLIRSHPGHYKKNTGELDAVERLKLDIWESIVERMEAAELISPSMKRSNDPVIEELARRFSEANNE